MNKRIIFLLVIPLLTTWSVIIFFLTTRTSVPPVVVECDSIARNTVLPVHSLATVQFHPINIRSVVQANKTWTADKIKVPFHCPFASIGHMSFPICTFPEPSDTLISGVLQIGGYWEKELVKTVLKFLVRLNRRTDCNNDVVFIDLGAFIGTYSLPVVHSGLKVRDWLT